MTQGLQTRYLVIKELIDTEAAYMTQLGYLSSWFELLELQGHTNDPVKSTQEALSQMIEAHQEWRALVVAEFNKVDQDGDGLIDDKEMADSGITTGRSFAQIDCNSDGKMDLNEFLAVGSQWGEPQMALLHSLACKVWRQYPGFLSRVKTLQRWSRTVPKPLQRELAKEIGARLGMLLAAPISRVVSYKMFADRLGVLAHVDHDGEGVADDLITSQILIELFQSLTVELDQCATDYTAIQKQLSQSEALEQLLPEVDRSSTRLLYSSDELVTVELASGEQQANVIVVDGLLLIWSDTMAERIDLADYSLGEHGAGKVCLVKAGGNDLTIHIDSEDFSKAVEQAFEATAFSMIKQEFRHAHKVEVQSALEMCACGDCGTAACTLMAQYEELRQNDETVDGAKFAMVRGQEQVMRVMRQIQ